MCIRPRLPLVALAGAALIAATWPVVGRAQGLSGDPRIDGVIPHMLPDPDPNILSDPRSVHIPGERPFTPPSVAPPPVASTASAPATNPEAATASAPASAPAGETQPGTASAPASGPEPASAPAASPATNAAPATESAPATTPAPAAP